MADLQIRYVVRFTGHVQGVGFRATTLSVATGLDVHGFVRNEPDGSVRLDVDGSEVVLRELVSRIETAMSGRIDGVQLERTDSLNRGQGLHIER